MCEKYINKIDSLVVKNASFCRLIIEELDIDIEKLSIFFFWDICFKENKFFLRKPIIGDISLFPIGETFDIKKLYEIVISEVNEKELIIYASVLEEYEGIEDYSQKHNEKLSNLMNLNK